LLDQDSFELSSYSVKGYNSYQLNSTLHLSLTNADPNSLILGDVPVNYCLDNYPKSVYKDVVINNMKALISYGAIFHLGTFSYPDIKLLFSSLNLDFDFNHKDTTGNNYGLYASNNKNPFHSDLFKDRKLDFNVKDAQGNTPLHFTILNQ
jgi:hypothetical protein